MTDLDLLADLHLPAQRQGPGADDLTLQALSLTGLDANQPLQVLDVGCGTGASTLCLAQALPNAQLDAVDLMPQFLEELRSRAATRGLAQRITTHQHSMDALPFDNETYDLLWAEGAIYNMGFRAGINAWRRLLKPGGLMVLTELTWLTNQRPATLQAHWNAEYPEVDTAAAKMAQLEHAGYSPLAYFALPPYAWQENYYTPLLQRLPAFLARHAHSPAAKAIAAAEEAETALYHANQAYMSYGCYIARKVGC